MLTTCLPYRDSKVHTPVGRVRHEGTPEGEMLTVDGVRVYIAKPIVDYPKDKAVLFLTDAFGLELVNNMLLADDFSRNGFYGFNVRKWISNHTAEFTLPPLNKVIAWLEQQGVKHFAAVGYCFGGCYTFYLAFENRIEVAVVWHPSLLKVPEDFEHYLQKSHAPLLVNSCTVDVQFPLEAQEQADNILGDGKFAPGYKRIYFEGCTHGFAVRGDMSDPKTKAGKEGSFKATVEWLFKYF
ncbi:hypothetical protein AGABI1DRAFT_100608 [Agaricus bisporus var. burnettii JB137-S8]|uniref:Dienelactone hydrolase domain-containing protein n=1 Tax=Agaricus bisporus var. burnettii (strain JB137-S8 / ATCC MYA-4627 / FGSC 10392) TaxID=597362 RepID=K5XWS4_AGABU|nr:uncharacterized protein AGABI1DRAFT_100608 [Agaricus bisporus var. burnettii JB137-S8]EKM79695.1 hypothetical protein AGABI1DRAFT_100608 [Agaricus bisporus var. burnettii JB137-S8]